jgi:hypothetical protein
MRQRFSLNSHHQRDSDGAGVLRLVRVLPPAALLVLQVTRGALLPRDRVVRFSFALASDNVH